MDRIMELTEFDPVRYAWGVAGFVVFALSTGLGLYYLINII